MKSLKQMTLLVLLLLTTAAAFADQYHTLNITANTPPNPDAQTSPKKGFVYKGDDPFLASKLSALGASWFYTWGSRRPEGVAPSLPFTPQIWGRVRRDPGILNELKTIAPQGDSGALLGANEPDFKKQSNLSVDEELDLWPAMEATGRRLGSPAMAMNPLKDGSWLREFLKKAQEKNDRVDFIAIHWYGPPNAEHFLDFIDQLHAAFGKPIWITEFAVADWQARGGGSTRYTTDEVISFIRVVLPGLEKRDFVEHYAWFSPVITSPIMGTSALFNADGTLTEAGQWYAKLGATGIQGTPTP